MASSQGKKLDDDRELTRSLAVDYVRELVERVKRLEARIALLEEKWREMRDGK